MAFPLSSPNCVLTCHKLKSQGSAQKENKKKIYSKYTSELLQNQKHLMMRECMKIKITRSTKGSFLKITTQKYRTGLYIYVCTWN